MCLIEKIWFEVRLYTKDVQSFKKAWVNICCYSWQMRFYLYFFNHPSIWLVLRLSSLNLKRSSKSPLKVHTVHITQVLISWALQDYISQAANISTERKQCFTSFITCRMITPQLMCALNTKLQNQAFREHVVDTTVIRLHVGLKASHLNESHLIFPFSISDVTMNLWWSPKGMGGDCNSFSCQHCLWQR